MLPECSQFYEFLKLVHDSFKATWHAAHFKWIFSSNNFMNLPNKFHKTFRTLWIFIFSIFLLAFSLFIGSSFVCVYLEASSLYVDFSMAFHYDTSKLEASASYSTLVFDYCSSQQTTQTQCSWSAQSHGLRVSCSCEFNCGKSVAMWALCIT